jgi:hypothetical protein
MTARSDFLRNLPASDFCPPEGAAATAGGLPVTADALARRTADTAEAVDEFAAGYWSMATADRRAEWGRLAARPADAPTAAFLKHLKKGLNVGPPVAPPGDPAVAELSDVARELFALRPRPRGVRRLAWLDARDRTVNWQDAVGRFWHADATAAEFDPPLVAFLDEQTPPPTTVGASTPGRADTVHSPSPGPAYTVDTTTDYQRQARRRREAGDTSAGGGSPWFGRLGIGGAVVVIIVIVRVVAACAGMGTKTSPNYSPSDTPAYTPGYTLPTWPVSTREPFPTRRAADDGPTFTFTADEVRACEVYHLTKTGQPPSRYALWLACNRPPADTPARANAYKR